MPRLFSAIEVPKEVAVNLTGLRAGLPGAHWVDSENYHITLRFIGDVDAAAACEFADQLAQIRAPSFELRLDALGTFGGRKPRAIWVAPSQNDDLDNLQRAHERAARNAGLDPESRNFKAHVTIARLRHTRAQEVASYLQAQWAFYAEFKVQRFTLFSSRASIGGGPYVVEQTYPLSP